MLNGKPGASLSESHTSGTVLHKCVCVYVRAGGRKISAVKCQVTIKITDGKSKKVVHVNYLHHRVQPGCDKGEKVSTDPQTRWTPPQMEHFVAPQPAPEPSLHRNPPRNQRPPDYFDPTWYKLEDEYIGLVRSYQLAVQIALHVMVELLSFMILIS